MVGTPGGRPSFDERTQNDHGRIRRNSQAILLTRRRPPVRVVVTRGRNGSIFRHDHDANPQCKWRPGASNYRGTRPRQSASPRSAIPGQSERKIAVDEHAVSGNMREQVQRNGWHNHHRAIRNSEPLSGSFAARASSKRASSRASATGEYQTPPDRMLTPYRADERSRASRRREAQTEPVERWV